MPGSGNKSNIFFGGGTEKRKCVLQWHIHPGRGKLDNKQMQDKMS